MHSLRLYGERLYEENWDVLILEKDCCSALPHGFALRLINLSCAIVALRGPGITRPWVGQHCLPTLVYLLLNSFIRVGVVFMLGMWSGGLFHIFVGSIRHCEMRYYPNFHPCQSLYFCSMPACLRICGDNGSLFLLVSQEGKSSHTSLPKFPGNTTSCPCSHGLAVRGAA